MTGEIQIRTDNQQITFSRIFNNNEFKDCYNFEDFRRLAKKNLPAPIFHYIDGGADDEATLREILNHF